MLLFLIPFLEIEIEGGGADKNKMSEIISMILKLNIKLDVTIQIRMTRRLRSFAPKIKSQLIKAPIIPPAIH